MLLAIDVGNTQTVVGVVDGEAVLAHWRLTTDTRLTGDEIGIKITALVQRWQSRRGAPDVASDVHGIAACSTVPSVLRELRAMCRSFFPGIQAVMVENAPQTGVTILTDNPLEVGTDRVVNALATHHRYGGPAICVDCGTATTFDVIASNGDYLGGVIAPGIQLSLDALATRGAQLRTVDISAPDRVLGTNTVDALRSGVVFGFTAQVDGLVRRLSEELPGRDPGCTVGSSPTVVATGGLASVIVPHSSTISAYEPWLTLIGLAKVFHQGQR